MSHFSKLYRQNKRHFWHFFTQNMAMKPIKIKVYIFKIKPVLLECEFFPVVARNWKKLKRHFASRLYWLPSLSIRPSGWLWRSYVEGRSEFWDYCLRCYVLDTLIIELFFSLLRSTLGLWVPMTQNSIFQEFNYFITISTTYYCIYLVNF